MKLQARHTVYSCYLGYVTQAIVNNLPPLLFLTFNREFGVSLDKYQPADHCKFLYTDPGDFLSPGVIKRTGYRKAALCSFLVTIIGLTGFYYLPFLWILMWES